jgi:hypothetical protein
MMSSLFLRRATAIVLSSCVATLVTGCFGTCKPGQYGKRQKYEIEVSLDQPLQANPVLVDLVGVNSANLEHWKRISMTKYWDPRENERKDAEKNLKTLGFRAANTNTLSLTESDPIWKDWDARGVTHVLVLADLTGPSDKEGEADARRRILALGSCCWAKGTKKLSVLVKRTEVEVQTRPLEAK